MADNSDKPRGRADADDEVDDSSRINRRNHIRSRSRSRSPRPRPGPRRDKPKHKSGGFKWKDKSKEGGGGGGDRDRGGGDRDRQHHHQQQRHHHRHNLRSRSRSRSRSRERERERYRNLPPAAAAQKDKHDKHKDKDSSNSTATPPRRPPSTAAPQQAMILVTVNDRLGTKKQIPCLASDTVGDFKKIVAMMIGRQPHEILLKRQSERPFKDVLTLQDYGVSNGVQLDLEVDTGD